jgi:hypothetical protein
VPALQRTTTSSQPPAPPTPARRVRHRPLQERIKHRPVLGGPINEYQRAAYKPRSRPVDEFWHPTGRSSGGLRSRAETVLQRARRARLVPSGRTEARSQQRVVAGLLRCSSYEQLSPSPGGEIEVQPGRPRTRPASTVASCSCSVHMLHALCALCCRDWMPCDFMHRNSINPAPCERLNLVLGPPARAVSSAKN